MEDFTEPASSTESRVPHPNVAQFATLVRGSRRGGDFDLGDFDLAESAQRGLT